MYKYNFGRWFGGFCYLKKVNEKLGRSHAFSGSKRKGEYAMSVSMSKSTANANDARCPSK